LIGGVVANIFGLPFLTVRSLWLATIFGGQPRETDISSSESQASAQARLSGPDENQGRQADGEPSASQRPQAAGGDDTEEVEGAGRGRFRFPREARIRKRSEVRDLYRRGKRRRTEYLDVFVAESPALRMRLAVVVPKHGRRIVERNRVKRRLRESLRLELLPHCRDRGVALDVLIRARPPAYDAEFEQLRNEIRHLAQVLCSQSSS
jgi:ribonuclease P protein component